MTNGACAPRRQERRTGTAVRQRRRTALRALGVVLLACWAVFGTGLPAGAADGDDGLISVFVVPDPAQTGGQAATLRSVATSTLGDPARAGEIFELNKGLAQPDGSALNNEGDTLRPGWILRLPQDASGPDVRQARDTASQSAAPPPAAGTADTPQDTGAQADSGTGAQAGTDSDTVAVPLPALLAGVGAVLLALVTAGIVARRRVRSGWAALVRRLRALGDPARRRRRLQFRRSVAAGFAADAESVRRAHSTLDEFADLPGAHGTPVHALRVDQAGVTAYLAAADALDAPWQHLDSTRWRRPAGAAGRLLPRGSDGAAAPGPLTAAACPVRVGTDAEGAPVFVDLSRLDGVLSVTGDPEVARDVVRGLLAELGRTSPGLPVTVLRGADGTEPLAVPQELAETDQVDAGRPAVREGAGRGTVRATATRRSLKGLVVVAGTPTGREAAELGALCGPGGAGWTGLVCGEADGAHWRWYAGSDGTVELPVLGVTLTVPA